MAKVKLPSEKKDIKKAKQKEQIEKAKQRCNDFKEVCSTPEGVRVMKYIMGTCAYQDSGVVMNPQSNEINLVGTAYNSIRRGVYTEIRKYLPKSALRKIELGG